MGSMFKSPKVRVPEVNIGSDIQQFVSGLSGQLPTIFQQEAQFRPQFQGLNLGDINAFLMGAGGQQGLFGLSGMATQQSQDQLMGARQRELEGMGQQAGLARGIMQTISPEAARQTEMAGTMAQQAFDRSQSLPPEMRREADQQARQAYQSRGMLGSAGSVASEILNREAFRQNQRMEAAQMGDRAFQMGQDFYTAPGLSLLSQQPVSFQTGQQMLGLGLGAIGAGTPQLFDTGAAMNIGAAQRQNQVAAQGAQAQANAARFGGLMGGLGSIGAAAVPFMFSDKRLKNDIKKVGKTNSGLPIYTYKYKGNDKVQMGVMAQEVEKKKPKAVKEFGGLKAVNYAMID